MEVLAIFLKLGLTSFGGPIAHLGYFRREFVERRRWLDESAYGDLVALCQFLPGPASSQVGFSIGLMRAGWLGALAAWCGFTLPSVLLLLAFAQLAPDLGGVAGLGLVHGLKLTAVAVVAQAVWDMGRRLCPDRRRTAIAVVSIALLAIMHTVYAQLIVIAFGAAAGLAFYGRERGIETHAASPAGRLIVERRIPPAAGAVALVMFCLLLAGLPAIARLLPALRAFDAFFRSGALVFGGGHVVLPLLQQQSAIQNAVGANELLAGYGAAQAVPGPLFSFAAYLGWMMPSAGSRVAGAALATIAIFLPGLLLVVAALPHWQALRSRVSTAAVFAGINAAVVGLLAFALYTPVWTSAVHGPRDFAIAAAACLLLVKWKAPPLTVVALCAAAGIAAAFAG
ncbi:chromate efflux transporter [Trinickia sp.]|uniref:chromate efflux transporter n=1 Tax=Trinickia sp. TaxID=2571163 RepID=UPI003F7D1065